MDGINGIAVVEAGSLGVGLVLVGAVSAWPGVQVALPALLAQRDAGFRCLELGTGQAVPG